MNSPRQRSLVVRFKRALSIWRRTYRIYRRHARRWDATCSGLRLTWAEIEL